jgi:hypothetical protein
MKYMLSDTKLFTHNLTRNETRHWLDYDYAHTLDEETLEAYALEINILLNDIAPISMSAHPINDFYLFRHINELLDYQDPTRKSQLLAILDVLKETQPNEQAWPSQKLIKIFKQSTEETLLRLCKYIIAREEQSECEIESRMSIYLNLSSDIVQFSPPMELLMILNEMEFAKPDTFSNDVLCHYDVSGVIFRSGALSFEELLATLVLVKESIEPALITQLHEEITVAMIHRDALALT